MATNTVILTSGTSTSYDKNYNLSEGVLYIDGFLASIQKDVSNFQGNVQKFLPFSSVRNIELNLKHGRNQIIRDLDTLKGKIQNNNALIVSLPPGKTIISNNVKSFNLSTDSEIQVSLSLGIDTLNITVSRQLIIDSFFELLSITNNGTVNANVKINASSPIVPKIN